MSLHRPYNEPSATTGSAFIALSFGADLIVFSETQVLDVGVEMSEFMMCRYKCEISAAARSPHHRQTADSGNPRKQNLHL